MLWNKSFGGRGALAACVCASFALGMTERADAGMSYGFGAITANNVGDTVLGESQLSVVVASGPGAGQISFTFMNVGMAAMSITDVYFDSHDILASIATIDDSDPGVSFSEGATPGNLPAANNASPAFVASMGLTADSSPPVQPNGVNPGETLTIICNLLGGIVFDDAIAALDGGQDLRIGIHVQGFATGGSESFVNVPTPGSLALMGLSGIAAIRRRR